MGKKKSKNKGKAPPRSSRTTSVAIAVCGLLVLLGLAYRFWPVAPPIPELDLASMEPQVAEKVEKHIEAVRRAPDSGEAFGRLAVVLQAHGLEAEASECYAQAIALEPGELRWEYLQVHALRSTEPEKALEQTVLALQVGDGYAPLHIIRAELLEERGESVLALEHFSKAVVLDPESAMAAFGAGRLLLSQGDIEKSLALLTRAAALDPDAGAIHASLAQVYRRRGDRDTLPYLERARTLRPVDTSLLNALGDCYERQQQPNKAKEMFELSLQMNSEQNGVKVRLASLGE